VTKLEEFGSDINFSARPATEIAFTSYNHVGFYVDTGEATRAIKSDGENRNKADETIATNLPLENPGNRD